MSLLPLGDLGGTKVEVNGSGGRNGVVNIDGLGFAGLELCDPVPEGCVLLLELGYPVLESVVLIHSEGNGNNDRGNGAVTVEVGPAKVEDEAEGSGNRPVVPVVLNTSSCVLRSLGHHGLEVEEEVNMLSKTEIVEDTGIDYELLIPASLVVELNPVATEASVRDDIPETGLLVAGESVGHVPHEVDQSGILLVGTEVISTGRVGKASPTDAGTY